MRSIQWLRARGRRGDPPCLWCGGTAALRGCHRLAPAAAHTSDLKPSALFLFPLRGALFLQRLCRLLFPFLFPVHTLAHGSPPHDGEQTCAPTIRQSQDRAWTGLRRSKRRWGGSSCKRDPKRCAFRGGAVDKDPRCGCWGWKPRTRAACPWGQGACTACIGPAGVAADHAGTRRCFSPLRAPMLPACCAFAPPRHRADLAPVS